MIDYVLIVFCLLFFILSIYLFIKKTSFNKKNVFYCALVFLFFIYTTFYVIIYSFTGEGINVATIYHLKYGLGGAGFGEYIKLIIGSIFSTFLGEIFAYWIYKKNKQKNNSNKNLIYVAYILLTISFLTHLGTRDFFVLYKKYNLVENTVDFSEYYRKPKIEKNNENKNLVFIYAESMERTFFNEEIFPGLITKLKKLENRGIYFTNINQVIGTGFTIAGVVASQCGLPLFNPHSEKDDVTDSNKFLSSTVCLGDLLKKEGYNLTYFGGAKLSFAGKGDFYSSHGFQEVYGLSELKSKVEDKLRISKWGLNDDLLFDFAYNHFIENGKKNEKQALFLLTLDTHDNSGLPSKKGCKDVVYDNGSNLMLNTVKCSDRLISQFVDKIINSPYGKDTTVVIVSDHLAMSNDASYLLNENKKERRDTFIILSPEIEKSKKVDRLGSTLDIGPTILPFLGFDSQLGLGRNLLSNNYSESEIKTIQSNIAPWRKVTSNFWDFSETVRK